jgi:hypothetical protein
MNRNEKIKLIKEVSSGKISLHPTRPLIFEDVPGQPEMIKEMKGKVLKKSELNDYLQTKKNGVAIIWAEMENY